MKKIALIGGGPAALFMYKQIVEQNDHDVEVLVFEKHETTGAGMPYSPVGADVEHITNVSGNELPGLVTSLQDWMSKAPESVKDTFHITAKNFNDYKVVPRLLFGQYLHAQFDLLYRMAQKKKIKTSFYCNCTVIDIKDHPREKNLTVYSQNEGNFLVDDVVICTGHVWPDDIEKTHNGWFDSPYPPQKLQLKVNFPVAIRGAALTAIDAVRSLAHANGKFSVNDDHTLTYHLDKASEGFRIVLHSISGFLPGVRFHLADTQLTPKNQISEEEIPGLKEKHGGFIPLDYIYKRNFLDELEEDDPAFYQQIKSLSLEEFIGSMLELRGKEDAFELLKKEYVEAETSIRNEESVYWKEVLAKLSYAMNYPAKHLSAEDMIRVKKNLMPLISLVIAFVPQNSCRELIALHEAGLAELVAVGPHSTVVPRDGGGAVYNHRNEAGEEIQQKYEMYINAVGQPPMFFNDFPFQSLKNDGSISTAYLKFKDDNSAKEEIKKGNKQVLKNETGDYYLHVPGISINDYFQVLDKFGVYNDRIYMMAVPFISGLNPDYSGLDFCEAASQRIAKKMFHSEG